MEVQRRQEQQERERKEREERRRELMQRQRRIVQANLRGRHRGSGERPQDRLPTGDSAWVSQGSSVALRLHGSVCQPLSS